MLIMTDDGGEDWEVLSEVKKIVFIGWCRESIILDEIGYYICCCHLSLNVHGIDYPYIPIHEIDTQYLPEYSS